VPRIAVVRLPSYLQPWRRRLVVAAVVGVGVGVALSVALVGAERTSGTVALAQFLLLAAVIAPLFYALCRGFVLFLRKLWQDPGFAREPDPFPEGFAVMSVTFVVAAALAVLTWAALGRGLIL